MKIVLVKARIINGRIEEIGAELDLADDLAEALVACGDATLDSGKEEK
jgi:hypothetical protein